MHPLLTKRIEVPWAAVLKVVAILLSLPAWLFVIVGIIYYRSLAGDYFPQILAVGAACCVFGSTAFVLLRGLRDGLDQPTRSSRFWVLWAAVPVILILLSAGVGLVYVVGYVLTLPLHVGGMHDSM